MDPNDHLREQGMTDDEIAALRRRTRAQLDEIHRKMKDVSEEAILELLRLDEEDRKRARHASASATRDA